MPNFETRVSGLEARNYIDSWIEKYNFENFQPINDLTDIQIETYVSNLETYLQTNIGTPNGYTIDVKLKALDSESTVDEETEVISRFISSIALQIYVT